MQGEQEDKDSLFVLNNFHFMIDFRLCAFLVYCMKLPFGDVSSSCGKEQSGVHTALNCTVL